MQIETSSVKIRKSECCNNMFSESRNELQTDRSITAKAQGQMCRVNNTVRRHRPERPRDVGVPAEILSAVERLGYTPITDRVSA